MSALIVFVFFIPFLISLLSSISVVINGSDHAYHLLLIKAIKKNDHRFISTMPFFIGKNTHAYPQLMHWVFSWFSEDRILRYAKYTGAIGHLLSGVSLYFFAKIIYPEVGSTVPYHRFMILVALIYAMSPINYDLMNAKNSKLSARGFGLFFGQSFTYLTVLFLYSLVSLPFFLVGAMVLAYLILLSSTFAMQYLILYSIIASIVFAKTVLLLPLTVGVLLFLLLHGKVAVSFFKGQYAHKKTYAFYLAKTFILKQRYSIWRDFIYDFWIKLGQVASGKTSKFSFIKYVMTNNLVNLLLGIPFLMLFLFGEDLGLPNLSLQVYIGISLFVFTSFRITRFLGEPERYVEFTMGILAVYIVIAMYPYYATLYSLFGLSLAIIVVRIIMVKKVLKNIETQMSMDVNTGSVARGVVFQSVVKFIQEIATPDLRIITNLSQNAKLLMSEKYKIFWYSFFDEYINGYHYIDIYGDSYFMINYDVLHKLLGGFEIDILVYSKNGLELEVWESIESNSNYKLLYQDEYNKVLSCRPRENTDK